MPGRRSARLLSLLLLSSAVAFGGCDNLTGDGNGGPLADLAGVWLATQYVMTNPADTLQSVDLIAEGEWVSIMIKADGGFTYTEYESGLPPGTDSGQVTVEGDTLWVAIAGEPELYLLRYELSGDLLTLRTDQAEWDFDDDGTPEPARAVYTFARQPSSKGVSVVQLSGSWKSTAATISLEGSPGVSVDLAARGGFFALELNPVGLVTIVRAWPAKDADVDWGLVTLQGDSLRADLEGADAAFGFQYSGGVLTLRQKGVGWDFSGDGNDQPAVLSVSLTAADEIEPQYLVNPLATGTITFTSQENPSLTTTVIGPVTNFALRPESDGTYESVAIIKGAPARHDWGWYDVVGNLLVLSSEPLGVARAYRYAFDGQGIDLEGNNETFFFEGDGREHRAKMQLTIGPYTWTVPEMAGTFQSEWIKVNSTTTPTNILDLSSTDEMTLVLQSDGSYQLDWTRDETTIRSVSGQVRNIGSIFIFSGFNPTGLDFAPFSYFPDGATWAPTTNFLINLVDQRYGGSEDPVWFEFWFTRTGDAIR
jgi:hypothetical protein